MDELIEIPSLIGRKNGK